MTGELVLRFFLAGSSCSTLPLTGLSTKGLISAVVEREVVGRTVAVAFRFGATFSSLTVSMTLVLRVAVVKFDDREERVGFFSTGTFLSNAFPSLPFSAAFLAALVTSPSAARGLVASTLPSLAAPAVEVVRLMTGIPDRALIAAVAGTDGSLAMDGLAEARVDKAALAFCVASVVVDVEERVRPRGGAFSSARRVALVRVFIVSLCYHTDHH